MTLRDVAILLNAFVCVSVLFVMIDTAIDLRTFRFRRIAQLLSLFVGCYYAVMPVITNKFIFLSLLLYPETESTIEIIFSVGTILAAFLSTSTCLFLYRLHFKQIRLVRKVKFD